MSEHREQSALFQWAGIVKSIYPELELLHAIPNGGHRHIKVAQKMKKEGVKSGVPDLCLPIARGNYHGLYIEMKFGKNKPTESQIWWHSRLRAQGYRVEVCWGWEAARDVIEGYLGNDSINLP